MLTVIERKQNALVVIVESEFGSDIKSTMQILTDYITYNAFNITYAKNRIKATIFDNQNGWQSLEQIEAKLKEIIY